MKALLRSSLIALLLCGAVACFAGTVTMHAPTSTPVPTQPPMMVR